MPISGRGDPSGRSRSIGMEVVVQADIRPWRYPPRLDYQYSDWWRTEFERNVLLTFARIWTTLATGVIRSKDGAADWALPLLPSEHRPVLAHARDIYLGRVAEEWGDLLIRVPPHVDYVVAEIRRVAAAEDVANG